MTHRPLSALALAGLLAACSPADTTAPTEPAAASPAPLASSDPEASIRANLAERLPGFPAIDEIRSAPVAGLYEVRIGTDVLYTDAQGDHILQGQIIDTRTRTNLTEARIGELTAIDFSALPLDDAFFIQQGNGKRRMVIFSDPNCGFCKRLERDLLKLEDVTMYTFLYPILGPDSTVKSRNVWCAEDPAKAWRDWMIDGIPPPPHGGDCDTTALERNLALGQRHRVQATPEMVFENGVRLPGALPLPQVEQRLAAAAGKS